jgi:Ran GTPase-activating protein (RanGAP) involved in mRNA processing and transport
MSGGSADLEKMRRIVARTPGASRGNPFDVLAGEPGLFGHIFELTGSHHVALRRTSKTMYEAQDAAGKRTAVEYIVDTAKFNEERKEGKIEEVMTDLKHTCQKFDVQGIKMSGLKLDNVPRSGAKLQFLELVPVLQACPGLTSLDLSCNEIKEMDPILRALAGCTGLTRLNLSRNNIWVHADTFGLLEHNTALQELNLYGNSLQPSFLSKIKNSVIHLPALTDLDLGRSILGEWDADEAASVITEMATRCTGLTRLGLQWSGLEARTVEGICRALPMCNALRELDLQINRMGALGLNHLGRVLGACPSLECLDVQKNMLANALENETRAFTDALPECSRLRRLDLSRNNLGQFFFNDLVQVLPRCSALEYLGVRECNVLATWVSILPPILARSAALRELDLRTNEAMSPLMHAQLRSAWAAVEGREPYRLMLDAPDPSRV